MTAIRRWAWPALLLAVFAVLFHRVLFLGEVFFFRDHYQEYYPLKHLALQMLRAGHLPVWNPASMMGQPLLANPNWTLLYPPNILLLVGDFARAYSLLFAAHFLVAGFGFYYMCRTIGRSPAAAALAALLYGCGGYFLSQGSFMPFLLTMAWQPLVIAEILRNLQDPSPPRRCALLGAVSLLILAGEPVTLLETAILVLVLGWSLLRRESAAMHRLMADWRLWISLLLLALAVFPRYQFLLGSGRTRGLTLDMATDFALDPATLLSALVPNALGDVHQYFPWRVFGAHLATHRFPYLLSIYFGPVCLLLAGLRLSNRPISWGKIALVLITLLLALGPVTPAFALFWKHVPLASLLRYPVKFLFFPAFLFPIWAAESFDEWLAGKIPAARLVIPASVLATVLGFAGWRFSAAGVAGLVPSAASQAEAISTAVRSQLLVAAAILLAALLALWLLRRGRSLPLLLVTAADLLLAGFTINPTASPSFYDPSRLLPPSAASEQRVMVLAPFRGVPAQQPPEFRSYSHYLNAGGHLGLYALSGADQGIRYAFDPSIDRSFSPHLQRLIDGLQGKTFAQAKPVFDLTNTGWFVGQERLDAPGLEGPAFGGDGHPGPFLVYRNTTALPRAFLTTASPTVVPPDQHAAVLYGSFDPRHDLLIDRAPSLRHDGPAEISAVTLLEYSPDRVLIRAHAESPAFLFCSDSYSEEWTARVDGVPTRVLLANGAFRAVELCAGEHTVEFRCRLWPHVISVAAVVLLTALVSLGLLTSVARYFFGASRS